MITNFYMETRKSWIFLFFLCFTFVHQQESVSMTPKLRERERERESERVRLLAIIVTESNGLSEREPKNDSDQAYLVKKKLT